MIRGLNMKLTKKQLEQVIKEELQKTLKESHTESDNPKHEEAFKLMLQVSAILAEHGSHPDLTPAYIELLRTAQAGGLKINYLLQML